MVAPRISIMPCGNATKKWAESWPRKSCESAVRGHRRIERCGSQIAYVVNELAVRAVNPNGVGAETFEVSDGKIFRKPGGVVRGRGGDEFIGGAVVARESFQFLAVFREELSKGPIAFCKSILGNSARI